MNKRVAAFLPALFHEPVTLDVIGAAGVEVRGLLPQAVFAELTYDLDLTKTAGEGEVRITDRASTAHSH